MTETALDSIAERVGYYHSNWGYSLDGSTRTAKNLWPETFTQALQDPRYIQYCEDQDRKEEVSHALEAATEYSRMTKRYGSLWGGALHASRYGPFPPIALKAKINYRGRILSIWRNFWVYI